MKKKIVIIILGLMLALGAGLLIACTNGGDPCKNPACDERSCTTCVQCDNIGCYNWNSSCYINLEYFNIDGTTVTSLTDLGRQLTRIVVPAKITKISGFSTASAAGALSALSTPQYTLETVIFEQGSQLTAIDAHTFEDQHTLTSITIPASVTSIGMSAFSGATALHTVSFEPNSQLQSIGHGAFFGATSLTSITIPAGVTSIGDWAFSNMDSLHTVTFEQGSQLSSTFLHI